MSTPIAHEPPEQDVLEELLKRDGSMLSAAERRSAFVVGAAFVGSAVALFALTGSRGSAQGLPAVAALVAMALAMNVRFDVGGGYTVATQLAFIPLLFALPAALIAPAVVGALMLGRVPDVVRGALRPTRLLLAIPNAWFALGPAVTLALVQPDGGRAGLGLVALVFLAQVAGDFAASSVREALISGAPIREQLKEAAWVYSVDAALAPIGFLAARTLADGPVVVFCLVPLLALLGVFSHARRARMESLLELNTAYRGTALVLGDVIQADDGYTGEHSQGVVELAMQVGRRLSLDQPALRNLEFAALLHDVGKIAIPKDIINKPGRLDPHEWAIIKTHTVEGQKMLDRIGGFMREVGHIVRSHHERWDGTGYPDEIAGRAISIEARIISCCDAYSAMTTTRSYRRAMPIPTATEELVRNAGTQFDPVVVDALLDVLGRAAEAGAARRAA
jgi:putative nucleotidyltransferase with HDIG domain